MEDRAKLSVMGERRGRLNVNEHDCLDGWDGEGLRWEACLLDLCGGID